MTQPPEGFKGHEPYADQAMSIIETIIHVNEVSPMRHITV